MAHVASQHGPRSIVVNHSDGHSWQYNFPIGSDEPDLRNGRPQWASAMVPADADALSEAAKASAIVLARRIGLVAEFETVGTTDDGIRVRDIHSGHEFTFDVSKKPNGGRILAATVHGHPNSFTKVDFHMLVSRARNYAEGVMLTEGKIDSRTEV